MSVISKRTKGKAGVKAAKAVAKRPERLWAAAKIAAPAGKAGLHASKPILKHHAKQSVKQVNRASRTIGEALAVQAPRVAYELGLAEPPKKKRTAPRLAVGAVMGASAVYFFEPGQGKKHRKKVAQLVS